LQVTITHTTRGTQIHGIWLVDTPFKYQTGQEIYYATHQFFLSERSLFLVVFNLLSLVQSRVEYWYAYPSTLALFLFFSIFYHY
jgi:hypothetical protein